MRLLSRSSLYLDPLLAVLSSLAFAADQHYFKIVRDEAIPSRNGIFQVFEHLICPCLSILHMTVFLGLVRESQLLPKRSLQPCLELVYIPIIDKVYYPRFLQDALSSEDRT